MMTYEDLNSARSSESYVVARRFLVTYSGLLILLCFGGISIAEQGGEAITFFGLHFNDIEKLKWAFFFLTLYGMIQYVLNWLEENVAVKLSKVNKWDRVITSLIFWFSILFFLGDVSEFDKCLGIILTITSSLIISAALAYFGDTGLRHLGEIRIEKGRKEEKELADILLADGGVWTLLYNAATGAKKQIRFEPNGLIVDFENKASSNEAKWQIKNNLLEILRASDKVFSRFAYDVNKGKFIHTNDRDTISLPNQEIFKPL